MDDVLKQRLIGAAVLIALAVIFVPMLFDRSQDPMLEKALDSGMPESPLADREIRRIPLNPNASRQGSANDEDPSAGQVEPPMPNTQPPAQATRERLALTDEASEPVPEFGGDSETQQRSDETQSASTQSPAALESDGAEPDSSEAPSNESTLDETATSVGPTTDWSQFWRVQVASFGVQATAQEIAESLEAMGQGVRVDRIVRGESVLYRIQTGPYADKEAAEQAQAMISESVSGVAPVIRAPSQVADEAGDVMPGYAVQVGSFTSQANAERLQQRLMDQGFKAFSVTERIGSRTIWRVRVGTLSTREAAEELLQTLNERASLEGLVVSHP